MTSRLDLVKFEERIREVIKRNGGPGNFDETAALFESSSGLTCIAVTVMAENALSGLTMADKLYATFILGWLLANKFRDGDDELKAIIADAPASKEFSTYVRNSISQLLEAQTNEKRILKI